MPFVVFLLILAGAAAVFVLYPHLRVLAAAVFVLFGAVLGYLVVDQTIGSAADDPMMTAQDIELSDMVLTEGSRFQKLSGRVTNASAQADLRSFDIRIRVLDCPDASSDDTDCAIIADDTGLARVEVPPGQTRDFEATLGFSSRTQPKGVTRWVHEIGAVRGTP